MFKLIKVTCGSLILVMCFIGGFVELTAAQEVKKGEVVGAQFHRAVISVKDLEKSLAFYRDLLGFKVFHKAEYYGETLAKSLGIFKEPYPHIKSVWLCQQENAKFSSMGVIELIQWVSPPGLPVGKSVDKFEQGVFVLGFSTKGNEIEKIEKRMLEHDVPFVVKLMTYSSGKENLGTFREFMVRDPDGVYLEIVEYGE